MYETNSKTIYGTQGLVTLFDRKFNGNGVKTISLTNYGPDTVSPCMIQWSTDGGVYGTADGTSFGSLGSGALGWSYMIDNRLFIRLVAQTGPAAGTCLLHWNINRP